MDSPTNASSEYFHEFDQSLRTEITINLINYKNLVYDQWTRFETNDYPWFEFKRIDGYDQMLNSIQSYYQLYVNLLKTYYNEDAVLVDVALDKIRIGETKDIHFINPATLFDNLMCHKSYLLTWRKDAIIDYKNKIDDFFKGYEILLLRYGNLIVDIGEINL